LFVFLTVASGPRNDTHLYSAVSSHMISRRRDLYPTTQHSQ